MIVTSRGTGRSKQRVEAADPFSRAHLPDDGENGQRLAITLAGQAYDNQVGQPA